MKPFIKYAGSKYSLAKRYGKPRRNVIVEPFAGSAGYSVYWNVEKAILFDKNERLINVWKWLIAATSDDIMDLDPNIVSLDGCDYEPVVQDFLGWNFAYGDNIPRRTMSHGNQQAQKRFAAMGQQYGGAWGSRKQAVIASQIHLINNWEAHVGEYTDAPDGDYHYHVDPPYQKMGDNIYRFNGKLLDFAALADWCQSKHCIDVCEGQGADWLPFESLCNVGRGQTRRYWNELIWSKSGNETHSLLSNSSNKQ